MWITENGDAVYLRDDCLKIWKHFWYMDYSTPMRVPQWIIARTVFSLRTQLKFHKYMILLCILLSLAPAISANLLAFVSKWF